MSNKYLIFFVLLFSSSFSLFGQGQTLEAYLQEKAPEAKEADGLYVQFEKEGKGNTPKRGDYVMVHFKGMLLDGTVFDESEAERPFVFQLGYRQVIRGWEQGIPLYKVGSKGQLILPPNLAYGKTGAGAKVPPNTPVVFDIELLKILDEDQYDDYMMELEAKERAAFIKRKKEQLETDKNLIAAYCKEKQLKVEQLPSGISYIITKKGKGDNAQNGNILTVGYSGYLLDGTKFDESTNDGPLTFVLGQRKVIRGWEIALKHFNKKSEGWILVPSELAYGPREIKEDNVHIPANAVLAFKVRVAEIK